MASEPSLIAGPSSLQRLYLEPDYRSSVFSGLVGLVAEVVVVVVMVDVAVVVVP